MYRVLIVDDDDPFAEFAKLLLDAKGYETLICLEGERSLDVARSEKPDLILMDVDMPDLNGLEAIRRLKADPQTQSIPVVLCSFTKSKLEVQEAFGLGAIGFISKPIKKERFAIQVAEAIHQGKSSG